MEGEAFERVESWEIWGIRVGQDAEGSEEVGRGKVQPLVSGNILAIAVCVVVGGGDFVLKNIVLQDIWFLGGFENFILESFRC